MIALWKLEDDDVIVPGDTVRIMVARSWLGENLAYPRCAQECCPAWLGKTQGEFRTALNLTTEDIEILRSRREPQRIPHPGLST